MKKFFTASLLIAFSSILFSSCMGMETTIIINSGNSGTVTAEYRLSEELVNFGAIEANKALLPIPITRADIENSLVSAQGLKLDSWSSTKSGSDTVIKTVISFDSLESLMFYLDPQGKMAQYSVTEAEKKIIFSLGDSVPPMDEQMKALAKEAFAPYLFKFTVSVPSKIMRAGSSLPIIFADTDGKKVVFEGKMQDIVTSSTAPVIEFSW